MIKKREIDIFGVLLGIVIGCIIGFFLSSRINLNHPPEEIDETGAVYGNVYLLQIDKLSSAEGALNLITSIKAKQLHAIYVKSGDYYYVIGAIAHSETDLTTRKAAFEYQGFSPIIKREYILDKANAVLDNNTEYSFYKECIEHLLSSLEKKTYIISDKMHAEPLNLEIYSMLVALQVVQNKNLQDEFRLNLYQEIIKNLD